VVLDGELVVWHGADTISPPCRTGCAPDALARAALSLRRPGHPPAAAAPPPSSGAGSCAWAQEGVSGV